MHAPRRPWLMWGAVAMISAAAAGALVINARIPAPEPPDAALPFGLTSAAVSACIGRVGIPDDVSIEIWSDDSGALSAATSGTDPDVAADTLSGFISCTEQYEFDPPEQLRGTTPKDRLAIYEWVVRVGVPCLAAHDVPVAMPSYRAHMRDPGIPGHLAGAMRTHTDDVDELAALYRSCPPLPPWMLSSAG